MRYFDVHLHLPSPDSNGLDTFLRYLDSEFDMVGGNLILNTLQEVEFASKVLGKLPKCLNLVPYYSPDIAFPDEFRCSGWFKIHPRFSRLDYSKIAEITDAIVTSPIKPKGLVIDCYPWGPELQYNINLPLVIQLAKALPDTYILATHGGGYDSWAFRAHTGSMKNVIYDFSFTMSYYQGSDILKPFQRYLRWSRDRVVFGSDWPSADCAEQMAECVRLAEEIGISETQLEAIFMENAKRIWPEVISESISI